MTQALYPSVQSHDFEVNADVIDSMMKFLSPVRKRYNTFIFKEMVFVEVIQEKKGAKISIVRYKFNQFTKRFELSGFHYDECGHEMYTFKSVEGTCKVHKDHLQYSYVRRKRNGIEEGGIAKLYLSPKTRTPEKGTFRYKVGGKYYDAIYYTPEYILDITGKNFNLDDQLSREGYARDVYEFFTKRG
jgi:hypothetical protein